MRWEGEGGWRDPEGLELVLLPLPLRGFGFKDRVWNGIFGEGEVEVEEVEVKVEAGVDEV